MPAGKWCMWYKDQTHGCNIMLAESNDQYHWNLQDQPAINGNQEGPVVFHYGKRYWMLTDEWHGMRMYRSATPNHWQKQGLILNKPSSRNQDKPSGAHGDVMVLGNKAYIFYFTHLGRKKHTEAPLNKNGVLPYNLRRSVIQVAPLKIENDTLVSKRNAPFDFWLLDK